MAVSHVTPAEMESPPRYKRQRTALACHSCRRRKTKCNGSRPACNICISMGFECSYPKPARVSFSANHDPEYIRRVEDRLGSLETLLETVISQSGATEDHRRLSNTAAVARSRETPAVSTLGQQSTSVVDEHAPQVVSSHTPTSSDLADDTVDGMGAITFADEIASGHFGATSNPALSNKINHALKEALNFSRQNYALNLNESDAANHISRPPSPYAMVSEKLTSPPTFERLNPFALPPPKVITRLVDRFFSETGMIFPYIHKKAVYDGIHNLKPPAYSGIRRSWLCLLNAIMAFATVLDDASEHRGEFVLKADTFLQRALKLLPNVALQPANIEILQALLLLTQYLQGTQRSTQTYNFQGLTVRVAFQLGLHSASSSNKESILEKEVKKRCWNMTYILDKTCSMTFGRPPCIRDDYMQSKPLLEVDLETLESGPSLVSETGPPQPFCTVSCFGQSLKLYLIVGEIIEQVYQSNIAQDRELAYDDLLQKVIALESKLESWKNNLPPPMKIKTREEVMMDPSESEEFSRLSTVLTLRYLSSRMLLHRAVLGRFLDGDVQATASSSDSIFLRAFERISLDLSVSAAVEMIEIHYAMSKSNQRMLTTWWFSLYYVFSSALVIFAAIIVQHRRGIRIESLHSQESMMDVLHDAMAAMEYLGSESRMASRCGKYLKKLMHGVMSLGAEPQMIAVQQMAMPGQDVSFDNFTLPISELSDISPMGLDMGPFMTGFDWDTFV